MRNLKRMIAGLAAGAFIGGAGAGEAAITVASAPANVAAVNQKLADDLARHVSVSGVMADYAVDFEVEGGVVALSGKVANQSQRQKLLNLTRNFPGVVAVNDSVKVAASDKLIVAGFQDGAKIAGDNRPAGQVIAPRPSTTFAGGIAPFTDAPVQPPHAWPAYTPYNNYASMAYQTQYPNGAWPFIGPPYPYPMIPAGWRHVSLRWSRGYWFLKFHSH
jgi:hypothetical protein